MHLAGLLKLIDNDFMSTNMKISGGYAEAADQNREVLPSKQIRGRNFPCPNMECILTFPTDKEMKNHLEEDEHVSQDQVEVLSTNDTLRPTTIFRLENISIFQSASGLLDNFSLTLVKT